MASSLVEGSLAKYSTSASLVHTQKDWWTWWFVWSALCILAYLTNPSAATFRTHLTSLSFQTHLRRLSTNAPANAPAKAPTSPNVSRSPVGGRAQPSHVLSFSNRISLAVRTPAYSLKSYYFFSTVVMHPAPVPVVTQGRRGKEKTTLQMKDGEVWVGAFGRWYPWRWESEEAEEDERKGRLNRGVLSLDVEEDRPMNESNANEANADNDSNESNTVSTSTGRQNNSSRPSRPSKRILRAGGRRASPTSLARLRSKAESSNNSNTPTSPTTPVTPSSAPPSKQPNIGNESGSGPRSTKDDDLAFAENDASNQLVPGHFSLHSTQTTSSSQSDAVETDPVLIELKMQLDELRASAAETERRLQEELEVLRGKKRDEDNVRAELKAKTKQLEEAKRVAELARVEAERELNERKARLREAKERVDKVQDEIALIDRREIEAEERREKKKRDRREREKKLREDVLKKRELLKAAEDKVNQLRTKVSGVEKAVEIRRELLHARKNELNHRAAAFYPNQPFIPPPPPASAAFRRTAGQISAPFGGHPLPHHAHLHANMGMGPGMATFGQPGSRPASIRSWDPQGPATYLSAPSSPVLTQPLIGQDDGPATYATGPSIANDPFYGGAFAADSFRSQQMTHQGFLEHRIQHRLTDHSQSASNVHYGPDGVPYAPVQHAPGALPSVDDIPPAFLPFDFESPEPHSANASTGEDGQAQKRPQLSLPLQYLDSGLLAGSMSPTEGPLSPMTPHQTSLIPSQLFSMLDDDDDDEFVMPDSPTLTSHQRNEDWMGLGLDVTDLGAPASTASTAATSSGVPAPSLLADLHENSQPAQLDSIRSGPLSPIEPRSPISPVSPMSEKSEQGAMAFLPSPQPTNATTPRLTSSSQQNLANAFGFAPSPWDPAPDQLLSSRLSPASEAAAAAMDDLPRAGLSLNPDAKAFAFQPLQSVAEASRAAFNKFPLGAFASASAAASGTRSGASSPTVSAFNSVIGPPSKSRMDFANGGSTSPIGSAAPGPSGIAAGFAFDWQRARESTSPIGSDTSSPRVASAGAQQSTSAFNPWGDN